MVAVMRRLCWIALIAPLAACGPAAPPPAVEAAPGQTDQTDQTDQSEPYYEREGLPGPWWREGATREMFETEQRLCLTASRDARAGADDPADAAYRAFLGCMQTSRWTRGLPPQSTRTRS